MRNISLHMLTYYPSGCPVRDDTNQPKMLTIGGSNRAARSPQNEKRCIRELFKGNDMLFAKNTACSIEEIVSRYGEDTDFTRLVAEHVMKEAFGYKIFGKDKSKGKTAEDNDESEAAEVQETGKTTNRISAMEYNAMAQMMKLAIDKFPDLQAQINKVPRDKRPDIPYKTELPEFLELADNIQNDKYISADIGFFGRNSANGESFGNTESAMNVAYSFSTHKVENDMDFFTAIDDSPFAKFNSHLGQRFINSSTMYRCQHVNIDLLRHNMRWWSVDNLMTAVEAWLVAAITAAPQAFKSNSDVYSRPALLITTVGKKGMPLSLSGAFEQPVRPDQIDGGFVVPSVKRLMNEFDELVGDDVFGVADKYFIKAKSDVGLEDREGLCKTTRELIDLTLAEIRQLILEIDAEKSA